MDVYTLLYLEWVTNKVLHRTLLSVLWEPGWEGSLGGEWIHAHVRLSCFTVHLKLSQHC